MRADLSVGAFRMAMSRSASDIDTCEYYKSIDTFTGPEVYTACKFYERNTRRALLQFF